MNEITRPVQLVLIRHGESIHNKAKLEKTYFADDAAREIVKGIPDQDIGLTEAGKTQANTTGVYLRKFFGVPDYVYDSGYLRTVQTREGISRAFSPTEMARMQLRTELDIRERDPGFTYNKTEEEVKEAFPWLDEYWQTFGGFFARPPGGESLADVVNRVKVFLNTIYRIRAGKKVWVVTHGGTIRAFRYILEHWTYQQALENAQRAHVTENCGVTAYGYDAQIKKLTLRDCNTVYWS